MPRFGRIFAILFFCSLARAQDVSVTHIPIGLAYAATDVNVAIFRCAAVVGSGDYQFTSYYDANSHIVVAKRKLTETAWDTETFEGTGNVHDAHNVISLGISSDGILHISYDQHGQPLHYRSTTKPFDVHSFGPARHRRRWLDPPRLVLARHPRCRNQPRYLLRHQPRRRHHLAPQRRQQANPSDYSG